MDPAVPAQSIFFLNVRTGTLTAGGRGSGKGVNRVPLGQIRFTFCSFTCNVRLGEKKIKGSPASRCRFDGGALAVMAHREITIRFMASNKEHCIVYPGSRSQVRHVS